MMNYVLYVSQKCHLYSLIIQNKYYEISVYFFNPLKSIIDL